MTIEPTGVKPAGLKPEYNIKPEYLKKYDQEINNQLTEIKDLLQKICEKLEINEIERGKQKMTDEDRKLIPIVNQALAKNNLSDSEKANLRSYLTCIEKPGSGLHLDHNRQVAKETLIKHEYL